MSIHHLAGTWPPGEEGIDWSYRSEEKVDHEQVIISFFLPAQPNRGVALRTLQAQLVESKVSWIRRIGDRWAFDLAKARIEVDSLKDLGWLNGTVSVVPEVELSEDGGRFASYWEQSQVQFSFFSDEVRVQQQEVSVGMVMEPRGQWVPLKQLGSGGQGTVYAAWRRSGAGEPRLQQMLRVLTGMPGDGTPESLLYDLLASLDTWRADHLGALKVLKEKIDQPKSLARARQEVETMRGIDHPNLIRLLEENLGEGWFVSEYFKKGSLDRHTSRFHGDVLGTLRAVRRLVEALSEIHKRKLLHRDIKMVNILVGDDDRLVLGDLGLVYNTTEEEDRLSSTFESAGTTDWMAPWTRGGRLRHDQANGRLDNFSIGKLIYCLIAGREKLVFWYHRKDQHNLEKLFPGNRALPLVNDFLDGCIVEDEKQARWSDASEMLAALDALIYSIEHEAGVPTWWSKRRCVVCAEGNYEMVGKMSEGEFTDQQNLIWLGLGGVQAGRLRVFRCPTCGNVQVFQMPHKALTEQHLPGIWRR